MRILVDIFFEDSLEDRHNTYYSRIAKQIKGFEDENLVINERHVEEVVEHFDNKQRFTCDVAIIHMDYSLHANNRNGIFLGNVIDSLLSKHTRRVVVSRESTISVYREMIKFQADHYFPQYSLDGRLLRIISLGKAVEEEILRRGVSITDENNNQLKVDMRNELNHGEYEDDYYRKLSTERK